MKSYYDDVFKWWLMIVIDHTNTSFDVIIIDDNVKEL